MSLRKRKLGDVPSGDGDDNQQQQQQTRAEDSEEDSSGTTTGEADDDEDDDDHNYDYSSVVRAWETQSISPSIRETIVFRLIEEDEDDVRWKSTIPIPCAFWTPDCKELSCELFSNQEEEGKHETSPDPELLQILRTILNHPDRLCNEMKKEFKKELIGKRKGSSMMWWSCKSESEFQTQFQEWEDLIKNPEDVIDSLTEPGLEIHHQLPKFGQEGVVCAAITFYAEWEKEHGVALITDGTNYLASGYSPAAM